MEILCYIFHNVGEKCQKSQDFCGRILARILSSRKVYEVFHVCTQTTYTCCLHFQPFLPVIATSKILNIFLIIFIFNIQILGIHLSFYHHLVILSSSISRNSNSSLFCMKMITMHLNNLLVRFPLPSHFLTHSLLLFLVNL